MYSKFPDKEGLTRVNARGNQKAESVFMPAPVNMGNDRGEAEPPPRWKSECTRLSINLHWHRLKTACTAPYAQNQYTSLHRVPIIKDAGCSADTIVPVVAG